MKIEQSAVAMNSGHSYSSEYEFSIESTTSFRAVFTGVAEAQNASAQGSGDRQARLLLMLEEMVSRLLTLIADASSGGSKQSGELPAESGQARQEALFAAAPGPATASAGGRSIEVSWTQEYAETWSEHESSDFSSTGKVLTADGRSLDFTLDLSMCRDFSRRRQSVERGTQVLHDPLVINFEGQAAQLEGKCFAFDLDADGQAETLHELGGASGYLAIDRNGDGRINDGSELFGPGSGDGFADLAALDGDGNHWIDEGDAAFSTLRVWQRDESGQDHLCSLGERGVGALYLGSTATPFALTGDSNQRFGQVRASGVYLNEDGSAGTLQQIDLAV